MSNKFKMKKDRQHLPQPPVVTKRLWHYTVYQTLQGILESGEIRVTSALIDRKERPVAWFSANTYFEQTTKKAVHNSQTGTIRYALGRDELLEAGYPPVRIEIYPPYVKLYDWEMFKKISGISRETAASLEFVGRKNGADPSE